MTSVLPAASSFLPITTILRKSLPFSMPHTKFCPASVRIAVSGSVGTGAPAASRMRPVANIPPRSTASGLGIRTKTRIARVPASVIGLMRSTWPWKRRSPKPSVESSTGIPMTISGISLAGTIACSSIRPRSTTVKSGESKLTFSPGCTLRLATVPSRVVITTASRKAFFASWTWASLDLSVPWLTERLLSALSYAVWEMKFCLSSARFWVRVFSARASCARLDSSAPMRSVSLASRSDVSKRARTWPALTDSPSRTRIWRISPETLALTVVWLTGCKRARDGQPAGQRLGLDAGDVCRREFERHGRLRAIGCFRSGAHAHSKPDADGKRGDDGKRNDSADRPAFRPTYHFPRPPDSDARAPAVAAAVAARPSVVALPVEP